MSIKSAVSASGNKRHFCANGPLLLPLALKWRLVRIVACSLFAALVLPCMGGRSVSAASITLSVPGRLTLSAVADGAFHESAAATVSVKSDAYAGYTLGIKSSESTSPALKNGSYTIPSISSAMAGSSFPVNTWGWLPSKLGGQANSLYQPGPTTTLVTIDETNSANSDTANDYTFTLGAKVNGEIPAGTYSNTFTFTVTAKNVPYNITYDLNGGSGGPSPNPQEGATTDSTITLDSTIPTKCGYAFQHWCSVDNSADPSACSGKTYEPGDSYPISDGPTTTLYAAWKTTGTDLGDLGEMQSFTCSKSMSIGSFGTVTDTRDDNTYCVRKLVDNKCWMTSNLRLGDSKLKNRKLTSDNTDLNDGLETYDLPYSSKDSFQSDDYDAENLYVVEADSGSGAYDEKIIYGGYYTYNAATAGTGASVTSRGAEASSSICPKGWRLPTGYTDGEFKALNDKLGGATDSDAHLINPDGPAFLRAGSYYDGSAHNQGSYGLYWSSTSSSSNFAYRIDFGSTIVKPAFDISRYFGFSVRCLAPEPPVKINYHLNGGSGGPSPNPQEVTATETTVKLDSTVPTKCGYAFQHWCSVDNTDDPTSCSGETYDAGASYDLSKGDDTTLYAVWNTTGTDLGDLGEMQSFTCSTMIPEIGGFGTVKDIRDDNTYCVRKLVDNKCWMTSNLRLGDSKLKDRTLTSDNTDLNDGLESYDLPASSKDGFQSGDYTAENIYVAEADSGNEKEIYGGYYTFNAATAGTGASVTSRGAEASSSICPKGWRLPTGYTDGEFKALNDLYGSITNSDAHLINPDGPAFLRAGYYYNGSASNQGSRGCYWSSTSYNSSGAYYLYFYSTSVNPSSYGNLRSYGSSVRCLAE